MTRRAAASLLLALLTGCAAPAGLPDAAGRGARLAIAAPTRAERVVVAIAPGGSLGGSLGGTPGGLPGGAPARALAAAARRWRAADVFAYDVALELFDPAAGDGEGAWQAPEAPLEARVLAADATAGAAFDGLLPGRRYRATVVARGNAGGTAPDQVLNQQAPAQAELDLADPAAPRRVELPVRLDDAPFDGTIALPNAASTPAGLPAWLTRMTAKLIDPAAPAVALATATWTPAQAARFEHVRGDRPYRVDFTVTSAAGSRTATLPDVTLARADGDATLALAYPAIDPPTGTLLSSRTLTSAFGVAVAPDQKVWITNQHHDTVTILDPVGGAAAQTIAVGDEPRGVAIDPETGTAWVANFSGGSISQIADGRVVATRRPGAFLFLPGGIAVDPQHRVWVTSVFEGKVYALNPDGTAVAGSPFSVGSQPAGLAIDPDTGDVWVTNSAGATLSRISAAGVVAGPFTAAGLVKPGGVAVGPDHRVWVSDPRTGVGLLRRFGPDGASLGAGVSAGVASTGVAVDRTSGVGWLAAQSGMRIFRYLPDGSYAADYSAGTIGNQVAIDARGHVWVAGNAMLTEIAP